jgi:alpha-ketoglutarate-dependent taurine dioxygenase
MNTTKISYSDTTGVNKESKDLILHALEQEGYYIEKTNLHETDNLEALKVEFQRQCAQIGKPIAHDAMGAIIWDIKSNASSKSFIKTYSEHSHEAELHTDSQYSHYPEDHFALLTLKKANCGGGLSFLLSLRDILAELSALSNGKEIENVLRKTDFPFIVPNVFKKSDKQEREYNFGPILRDNEIRFRVDTFEKAIKEQPDLCSEEQLNAYQALKKIILNSTKIKSFYLEDGDLIFINNKTMLNGRSSFEDEKRHILRIRMNSVVHN